MKTRRANIGLLVITIMLILLVMELAVRTGYMIRGKGFFSDHRNLIRKSTQPVRPFRTFGFDLYKHINGVKYISSCHGELFPLNKSDGVFRIVVFGGSTTKNKPVFQKEGIHYPLVLQTKLREALGTDRIEVINLGYAAYSTAHSLILLELDVISWKPELVILSHNINDLLATYWPDFTFDYSNKYSYKGYSIPPWEDIYTLPNIMFQHSRLYWSFLNRIYNQKLKRTSKIKRISYGVELPGPSKEVFQRNLKSFITIAESNGIRVILGNQPLQPNEEYFIRSAKRKSYNSIIRYPLHQELINHHRTFNEIIRKTAEERGLLFVDNNAELNGAEEYFRDYVHYTPDGVRLLAGNYADHILKNNIIPAERSP